MMTQISQRVNRLHISRIPISSAKIFEQVESEEQRGGSKRESAAHRGCILVLVLTMIASSARNLARIASVSSWRRLSTRSSSALAFFHSGNVKNMSPHLRTKLPPLINTAEGAMGTYLKTATDISQGQTVLSCIGELVERPTIHTVQISENLHMDNAGRIKYTSHSCDPNSKMVPKKTGCELIAIKDISAGETLSFDYETTEWDMSAPFDCLCGSANCKKVIRGYKHLSDEARARIGVEHLSDYVKGMHALHSKRQG